MTATPTMLQPLHGGSRKNYRVAAGHPRVMVRPEDVSELRRRAQTTHRAELDSLLALAAQGPQPGNDKDYADATWRLAFLYLLTGDPAHAQAANEGVKKVLEQEVSGQYFVGARRLKALGVVYDWVHDRLTPELRRQIGERAMAFCQALYDSGEIEEGIYILGHGVNQMPAILMACIGMADEIEGAHRFLENQLWRLEQHLPGYRKFLEQDSFLMSYPYTSTYTRELPLLFQLLEKGLGEAMFQKSRWLANVMKWWTYAFRDDKTFVRFGDYFTAQMPLENLQYYITVAAIAKHYNDPLAKWWLPHFKVPHAEVEAVLFEARPNVGAKSPEELGLPRTRLFEPMGIAYARGDFSGEGTIAAFKCTPVYLHNHCHRDANQFVIYHKGDLAIDAGAYDGYETPQWYNYYIRTIAHNTIVVHDPDEVFDSRGNVYANDGGQRFVNQPHFQPRTIEEAGLPAFRDGQIRAYRDDASGGFSYVCGDASNCYRREKLKSFLRHVVFVLDWPRKSCVSMVVLDEIELSKPGLEPRFLLHTMAEPEVSGSTLIARHGAGRLTVNVLLPVSPKVELIGGPDREFVVDGKNYGMKRPPAGPHTPGWGRAEVSGGTPSGGGGAAGGGKRTFLTFLAANDASAPAETPASFERVDGGYVVKQGGLTVVLTRGGRKVDATGERVIRVELA